MHHVLKSAFNLTTDEKPKIDIGPDIIFPEFTENSRDTPVKYDAKPLVLGLQHDANLQR
jgi:hypothetical protein